MKLTIKAEGINDEAIKVLTKAVKSLYKPYVEHYMGCERFEIKIGGEYERDEYVRRKNCGAMLARYVNPEVTKAFEEMDKEDDGKEE